MKYNNYPQIPTDETFMECSEHGTAEYPFRYYYEDIWEFNLHRVDWHWHNEFEFIYVMSGTAYLSAGSERYTLNAGEGTFINSKVIHRLDCTGSTIVPNIVFSPEFLAPARSLIYKKYIAPVIDSGPECMIFSPDKENDMHIISALKEVFSVQDEKLGDIKTSGLMINVWYLLYENVNFPMEKEIQRVAANSRSRLQIMMQFIHTNYSHKITLDDIAGTVSISKNTALHLFGKYLHISPVNYLIEFRLEKAAKLLTETEKSIAAIASETGFENVGYFCRKFKSLFGTTPKGYRTVSSTPLPLSHKIDI